MRAILIDPANQTITEVSVEDFDHLRQLLSYDTETPLAQPVELTEVDRVYLDEESLLKKRLSVWHWHDNSVQFAGRGIILGSDEEGEDASTGFTLFAVKQTVQWTNMVTTGRMTQPYVIDETTIHGGHGIFDVR